MALSTISGTTGITDATITSAKLADFAAAVDLNGVELILDADQDTSITADTDDRIDFKIAGVEHFSFSNSSGDTIVKPMVDAKDIKLQQFDGRTLLDINDAGFVGIENGATGPGAIRIFEDSDLGSNYVGLSVGNVSTAYTLVFPNADGSSGQALTTNGSGVLSFSTVSANTPSSADGQALGSASLEWSDLFLADASTIQFGADQDVTLTHVADTGLLLNTASVIQFRDSAINIGSPADGDLDINADDEIELNSTLIDVNGNVEISGTLAQADAITMATNKKIIFRDAAIHISSTADGDLAIAADDEIDLTSTLIDINGAVDISGATTVGGILKTDDATDATSTTDGSLQTDGGLSVAKDVVAGDDIKLLSDAAVLSFGANSEVTLTHVHDDGLLLNTDMQLQFRDSAINIRSDADGDLDINADDEIELNSTLIDINGNVEISGTATTTGVHTFTVDALVNGITVGKGLAGVSTNTAVGGNALDANTSGSLNVAIGFDALTSNTSGAQNVAIGRNSLRLNTTALGNTAIGTSALSATLTGATNTAVGADCLKASVASNNTAVGYQAMQVATSASDSVAVGREALGAGTNTGTGNTGLGYTAGKVMTSGNYNTLAGYKSGLALTTGSTNTIIGYEAGDEQTATISNTVIGDQAGQKHTVGYSVMIGSMAGQNATSAHRLIAIGRQAGGGGTMTGNDNVLIGKGTGFDATSMLNNTLIGNEVGANITTGVNNTIVGYGTAAVATTIDGNCSVGTQNLNSLTTGNTNDAFGVNTLYRITTGYDNAAYGNAAGAQVTTGFRNTFLGHEAGTTNTTGSNNTLIGYLAAPSGATVSNEMTFGNSSVTALRSADQSIAALSDGRDKTDIVDLPHGLDFINQTRPVRFKWDIRDGQPGQGKQGTTNYGFIAQELLEVGDNEEHRLVYESNPDKLEARYSNLIPMMVKAIQELSTKVKELENK